MAPLSDMTSPDNGNDNVSLRLSPPQAPLTKCPSSKSKRVSFGSDIEIREVPHLNDMASDEIDEVWYSLRDMDEIKKRAVMTVRLMMANKPLDESQSARGLEFRTMHGARIRKYNKQKAIAAVWNEQISQWKDRMTDEEAISTVYQEHVWESQAVAQRLAMQDQDEAKQYYGMKVESIDSPKPTQEVEEKLRSLDRSVMLPSAA